MKLMILAWLAFAALFVMVVTLGLAYLGLTFEFTSIALQGVCLFLIGGGVLTFISIGGIIKEVVDISVEQ